MPFCRHLRAFPPKPASPTPFHLRPPPPPPAKMTKPVALYLLIAAAILLFLSFPRLPHSLTAANPNHRRSRRLSLLHPAPHVAFDPLISQLEDQAEERGLLEVEAFRRKLDAIWEKQEWGKMAEEVGALGEYFGDGGRLNLTERLIYLFPLLDRYPQDGGISRQELEVWVQRQAVDRLFRRTERKLKLHDRDGDGGVTLQEFLAYNPEEEIDWNNMENGKPGWWKEQFSNADLDGNGALNASEFNDFLHPEDSLRPKILLWLLKEKLREFDKSKDGKLDLKEFGDKANEIYQTYSAYLDDERQHHQLNAEEEFKKLDFNKDKFLTAEELRPIIQQLYPGELSQSLQYTKYLMRKADENRDGKLTLKEILQNQYAFYTTVYEGTEDDDYDYDDYDYHDELRR